MNDTLQTVLAICGVVGIPVGSIIAALLTARFIRKSAKESNDTNAFEVITNSLFKRLESLETQVKDLEGKVDKLEDERDLLVEERDSLRHEKSNLLAYIKKLIALLPQGTPLPTPTEPIDLTYKV